MRRKTTYDYQKEYIKYLYLFIKIIHYLGVDNEHDRLLKRAIGMGVQTTYYDARSQEFIKTKLLLVKSLSTIFRTVNFNGDFYTIASTIIDNISMDIFDGLLTQNYDPNWSVDAIRTNFKGRDPYLDEEIIQILKDRSIMGDLTNKSLTNKSLDFLLAMIVTRKKAEDQFDNCISLLKKMAFSNNVAIELFDQEDMNIAQMLVLPNNIDSDYKRKDHLLLDKMQILNRIIILDQKERLHLNKNKGVAGTIVSRLKHYEGDEIDLALVATLKTIFLRDKFSMLDINNDVDFIYILESIRHKNPTIDGLLTTMLSPKNIEKQVKNNRDHESLKKIVDAYVSFLKRNNIYTDKEHIYKFKKGSLLK
jgi:hypothetical protein